MCRSRLRDGERLALASTIDDWRRMARIGLARRTFTSHIVGMSNLERPLPGTGRLEIVSGVFFLIGLAGVFATTMFALATPKGLHGFGAALVGMSLSTVAALRTSTLISRRRKSGALLAAIAMAGTLLGGMGDGAAALICLVGIALLASVWQYLE